MNKFEQLIEFVINDEDKSARELFHQIVVEKSRDIYENLMSEDENDINGLDDDIAADEEGFNTENDFDGDNDEDDNIDSDADKYSADADEFAADDDELEDRVVDLEDKLDDLMAEFETLVADEDDEVDDIDDEELGGDASDNLINDVSVDDDMGDEETDESFVREYTEKVGETGQTTESGKEVATGGSAGINKQSTVAGKNPLGNAANAKNIAQSEEEQGGKVSAPGKLSDATTEPHQKEIDSLKKV